VDDTHVGKDVVRCRDDDAGLLLEEEPSVALDPAEMILADRTLPAYHQTTLHLHRVSDNDNGK